MRGGALLLLLPALVLAQALARTPRASPSPPQPDGDAPSAGDDEHLTCFTCSNVTDNDHCNRYAIDRPCQPGLSLCRTDHVVERAPQPQPQRGAAAALVTRSVRVSKACVSASECDRAAVGCRTAGPGAPPHLKVCTSCCDWSYCNELAPSDSVSAVLALSRSGAGGLVAPTEAIFMVFLMITLRFV